MTLTVHLFAAAAERMKCGRVEVPLPNAATVIDLRAYFRPSLAGLIDRCAVAVNHEYATDEVVLNEGDEVAVIPPVAGG